MNNAPLALNNQPNAALTVLPNTARPDDRILTSIDLDGLQNILELFSTSSHLDDNIWQVHLPSSTRTTETLNFPTALNPRDALLLKAAVLNSIARHFSLAVARRLIHDAPVFFAFLADHKIRIENCRSATIDKYIAALSDTNLNDGQKNNLLRSVSILLLTCQQYHLISGSGAVDCSFRFSSPRIPKRAPDECVIDALDTIFFDNKKEIPNWFRCIYLILRLIPNRISEVLTMDLDCITYPQPGVYNIIIPTFKETPFHIPEYKEYPRKIAGFCESILFASILEQQNMVRHLHDVSSPTQGYLFLTDSGNPVQTADFNRFLAQVIDENHIMTASGEPAKVTSHDLRHVAIGERLRGGIISPELTMLEANHHSIEQTIGYGYQSEHDEALHLGAITSAVINEAFNIADTHKPTEEPKTLSQRKFERVKQMPQARIIPGYGLCTNATCTPRYEACLSCVHFSPDPIYYDYFVTAIDYIQARLTTLKGKHGSQDAIAYNEHQLSIYQRFIELINIQKAQNEKVVGE